MDMAQIEIEVSDETAKRWRLVTQQQRDRISEIVNIILAKELMLDSPEEFEKFLDEIGETMEERGLTEEILQDILKDDN